MYKTVLFDLDGTLLNTIDDLADSANRVCAAHGWPQYETAQYRYFVGNGIPKLVERFSPADCRSPAQLAATLAEFDQVYGVHMHDKTAPYPGIPELLARLKAAGVKMAVFSNKADEFARAVVARYFDADLFEIVRNDPKIVTNVYREDEWYMNRHRPEEMRFFKEAVFNYKLYEPGELDPQGISKVFFTCEDHEHLLPLEQAMNARWGDRVNVSFSTLTCLEVMAGGVSKGHALEAVAKMLGYTLSDCIAFGDGMNDAEMLSMAGKGCIMANAHQRLKDLHPELEVIGSNADDAVPHYLRKLYLD